MTLAEIRASDKAFLTPAEVAPVIQCDPQFIRDMARQNPAQLGFPVTVMGKRTKIPRIAFLRFLGFSVGKYEESAI